MSLRTIIEDKYKKAIKTKNANETNTLRLIKSAIIDKDISSRSGSSTEGIADVEILSLLQNLIKQRKDSIDSFKLASRKDLIAIEQDEIDVISQFLPQQLNEEDTEKIIEKIISENNFSTLKDMGALMKNLKSSKAGSIDMTLAGKIAKSKLS
ncbi:GatB/YqeY domain-containing protein [Alphaproteobacteria bacterium]|nr:GatB/YqeY domain-containing protein [Alphaproteobacteria bacterium]